MKKSPTLLPVVAAALIAENGDVLMQRRRAGAEHGGLWEFPGGKVEPGETPHLALVRELAEELGIVISPADLQPVSFASHSALIPDEDRVLLILLFACRTWQGTPLALDADAVGWFAPAALDDLAMPPLDRPLAADLRKVI